MKYIASPYSSPSPAVRAARFRAVVKAAARLRLEGHDVYSPILEGHTLVTVGGFPLGYDWLECLCFPRLIHAKELWILTLPGWDQSEGITEEVLYFYDHHPSRPRREIEPTAEELAELTLIQGENQ